MVVPRCFFDRTAAAARRVLFLERTARTNVEDDFGLEIRKLYRLTRPCFSLRTRPDGTQVRPVMPSTPQLVT
jgi:hypothetical protein